jgi:hypothetical protein
MLLLAILGYCRLFHLKLLLSIIDYIILNYFFVPTLALGSQPRQGFVKVQDKKEA